MKMQRQRGISLLWVAAGMAAVGLVAMGALMSMRYERNLFAETWTRLTGSVPSAAAAALAPAPAALRKCVIGGKTVVSDTDCKDDNKTSRTIEVHDTRGIEAPKAPPREAASAPTSDPALDKLIEKQFH